jgi:sulfonate transport system permease protein
MINRSVREFVGVDVVRRGQTGSPGSAGASPYLRWPAMSKRQRVEWASCLNPSNLHLAATLLGVTGYSGLARRLLDPLLQSLRSIPSMAWVPLFLLWLGIGESSKIFLIALGVFFPVYLNLMNGVRNVDRKLVEAGLVNGFHGFALAKAVVLPASLPAYLVGLRQGLSLGWMFVVAAEIMGASRGLGYLLIDGQTTGRPAIMMSSVILFAIC